MEPTAAVVNEVMRMNDTTNDVPSTRRETLRRALHATDLARLEAVPTGSENPDNDAKDTDPNTVSTARLFNTTSTSTDRSSTLLDSLAVAASSIASIPVPTESTAVPSRTSLSSVSNKVSFSHRRSTSSFSSSTYAGIRKTMVMYNPPMTPTGPFSLQLGPNITTYPFVHQTFSIPLFLYDGNRELVQGYEIPVIAELFYQQSDTALVSADDICVSILISTSLYVYVVVYLMQCIVYTY